MYEHRIFKELCRVCVIWLGMYELGRKNHVLAGKHQNIRKNSQRIRISLYSVFIKFIQEMGWLTVLLTVTR